MKKIFALSLIAATALSLSGCSATKPREFTGTLWATDMKNAVEALGINCDAWVDPEPSLDGTVQCNSTVYFTSGGLILDSEGKDTEGKMKSLAEYALTLGKSSTYASNWMIIAEGDDLKKISEAFHGTIVTK